MRTPTTTTSILACALAAAMLTAAPGCGQTGGAEGDAEDDTGADTGADTAVDAPADTAADTGADVPDDTAADVEADGTPPAVTLTVTNVGFSAYDFTAEDPAGSGVIGGEAQNQTLTLTAGLRYGIVNLATGHPFELVTLGTTSASDVVLLSESAAGSLESDPEVDWVDGAGTIAFTVAPSLAAALSGYRCSIHVSSMRGSVIVE